MNQEYRIKGSSIRCKLDFVRERYGAEAEQALRNRFDRKLFPILDSSWYPFSFYEALVKVIVDEHLGGDMTRLREVGVYSAEKVLTSVYKLFTVGQDFVGFLKRAEALHGTCYNQGGMKVAVAEDRKSCQIHLTAPTFAEADLHIAAGFYAGAGKLLGEHNVSCTFVHNHDGAHFQLRWT